MGFRRRADLSFGSVTFPDAAFDSAGGAPDSPEQNDFCPGALGAFGFAGRLSLERFPIRWNHLIEKESLKIKELEHVRIEKVEQLFRDML